MNALISKIDLKKTFLISVNFITAFEFELQMIYSTMLELPPKQMNSPPTSLSDVKRVIISSNI